VVKIHRDWNGIRSSAQQPRQKMAKIGSAFTTSFVTAGVFLVFGSYLEALEISDDPVRGSSFILIVGATFIAAGVATLYSGIESYRHHRAVVRHIRRRHEGYERVRVKKRRQARPDP
jgi:hypothetical protein